MRLRMTFVPGLNPDPQTDTVIDVYLWLSCCARSAAFGLLLPHGRNPRIYVAWTVSGEQEAPRVKKVPAHCTSRATV